MYSAQQYRDTDSGRYRWAVLCSVTSCWYFPKQYGKAAAEAMAARMNKEA